MNDSLAPETWLTTLAGTTRRLQRAVDAAEGEAKQAGLALAGAVVLVQGKLYVISGEVSLSTDRRPPAALGYGTRVRLNVECLDAEARRFAFLAEQIRLIDAVGASEEQRRLVALLHCDIERPLSADRSELRAALAAVLRSVRPREELPPLGRAACPNLRPPL